VAPEDRPVAQPADNLAATGEHGHHVVGAGGRGGECRVIFFAGLPSSSFQSANPESITTNRSIDSGPAPAAMTRVESIRAAPPGLRTHLFTFQTASFDNIIASQRVANAYSLNVVPAYAGTH